MEEQAALDGDPRIDEEDIRLTTGFADIFTAVLLVMGGAILAALAGLGGGIAIVVAAFMLGRPLVERRRFAASGNVLAVGAALGTGVTLGWLIGIAVLIPVAAVCYGFWRVHRVPLAMSLVWLAGAGFVAGIDAYRNLGQPGDFGATRALVAGMLLFGAAMYYDTRDPVRRTRLTDVAFWLHLAAAPLLVHGFFSLTGSDAFGGAENVKPALILITFAVLAAISLLIDRRPLLASSFIYLVAATYSLLRDASEQSDLGNRELTAAMAPALIGILLLFLAAGWSPLRGLLLRLVPADLARFLPPRAKPRDAALAPERPTELPAEEKEPVRLVLGFNDFFVALGALSLFVGCIFVGVQIVAVLGDGAFSDPSLHDREAGQKAVDTAIGLGWIPIALPALAMWLVAEWFVRVRRMAWPAIVSAFAFALTSMMLGIYAVAIWWYSVNRDELVYTLGASSGDLPHFSAPQGLAMIACACLLAAAASLAFWLRHRVPVSFALACATLLPILFAPELAALMGGNQRAFIDIAAEPRLIGAGLAAFAAAMAWDRSDPERATSRSDTAFWLHLLAGLLVVPAMFALFPDDVFGQVASLLGFAALTVVAVLIDRRAPLMVALPAFARTLNHLAGEAGGLALTLLGLLALLALVLRWDEARGWLIKREPSAAT